MLRLPEFLGGILAYGLFRGYRDRGMVPGRGLLAALVALVVAAFLVADYLFTQGAKHWYFLLHNGLLLPAQLLLCAFARCPPTRRALSSATGRRAWGRLAVAVRPACADVHPVLP